MGKILAIKGHPTRGNEVIEILEMLGGVNGKINKKTGKAYNIYNGRYFIDEICNIREVAYYYIFGKITLFFSKMPNIYNKK